MTAARASPSTPPRVLAVYGVQATVYCVSGHVGGANDWPTQASWAPRLALGLRRRALGPGPRWLGDRLARRRAPAARAARRRGCARRDRGVARAARGSDRCGCLELRVALRQPAFGVRSGADPRDVRGGLWRRPCRRAALLGSVRAGAGGRALPPRPGAAAARDRGCARPPDRHAGARGARQAARPQRPRVDRQA